MRKRSAISIVLCIIMLILILSSSNAASPDEPVVTEHLDTGEMVVRIQIRLRELGYFMFKPTGSFQNLTVNSVIAFQQKQTDENGAPITADGSVGPQSRSILFSNRASRMDILTDIPFGQLSTTMAATGELVSWETVKSQLRSGQTYIITDCYSGTQFSMTFVEGENHAEMKCVTAEDEAVYKELFGGEYNYSKRPVLITLNGKNTAASLQGMPHGTNNHSCMYFDGSLSHVGTLSDIEQLNQVHKAAGR